MRAIEAVAFGGPEVLELRELPDPIPAAGGVLIEVAVAPVLFVDTQIRSGLGHDWFPARPPYVPGAGVTGTIVSVGADVDSAWVGRPVVADTSKGGYLEQATVPAAGLIPLPDGLDLDSAAALLHDGRTALALVEATNPQAGEWVLVVGAAGGLGLLLVQLACRAGSRVIGAARGAQKLALIQKIGAEVVIDYSRSDWADQVTTATRGASPSLVLDGVGGETGRTAFALTASGGRFSAHGTPGGGFAPISPGEATRREISLLGIDRVQLAPAEAGRLTTVALSQAAAGTTRPVIGQTFPLEHAAEAHQVIESRNVVGKSLLVV